MHYIYILRSTDRDKFYVGRTANLKRRIKEHKGGQVYTTRRMGSLELIFFEAFRSKEDAIRRERYLKTQKGRSTLNLMLREYLQIKN